MTPQESNDSQNRSLMQMLHYLLIFTFLISISYTILTAIIANEPSGAILSGSMSIISGVLFWQLKRGKVQLVSSVLIASGYIIIFASLFMNGGLRDEAGLVLIALLSIAGFLLGMQMVIPLGTLTAIMLIILYFAETLGLIEEQEHFDPVALDELAMALIGVFVTTIIIYQLTRKMMQNNERIETQSRFVFEKNQQLEVTQQALIAAKEEAEEANRSRSIFFSRISHDLRAPLSSILGLANHLQRHADDFTVDERQEFLQAIEQSGTHLLNLINDLMDISKLESKQLTLHIDSIVLATVVSNVITMLNIAAKEKGLHLSATVEEAVPKVIDADDQRLRQLLINLISNGIKFTERGEVTLDITAVSHPHPAICFKVKDTGQGIAHGDLDKIFSPFVQTGDKQQQFSGTGLGLAISKHLVEAMGSTLNVESQLGVGSSFWFELPIQEASGNLT